MSTPAPSAVVPPAPRAVLTDSAWTPLGELSVRVELSALSQPSAPGLIGCEIRTRDQDDLASFPMSRDHTDGASHSYVGLASGRLLESLAIGTHDLWVVLRSAGRRHQLRVVVPADATLPPTWSSVESYATNHANLSWHKSEQQVFTFRVRPTDVPTATDLGEVDPDLVTVLHRLQRHIHRTDSLGPTRATYFYDPPRRGTFGELFPDLALSVSLTHVDDRWEVSATGRGKVAARLLRNTMVNHARLVREGTTERHLIATLPDDLAPGALTEQVVGTIAALRDRLRRFLQAGPTPSASGLVPAYWWDVTANFGDLLGPMLIDYLGGSSAINVRSFPSSEPALYSVGSVVGHLTGPGATIWGAGVIGELSAPKVAELATRRPAAITAVRGALTRRELTQRLGWDVPEVYGDPALLLPRFYAPRPAPESAGKIVLVPHYKHKHLFEHLDDDHVFVLDVQQGPEVVIDQIAAASHCISSSLHGLVIAQAYGVPWTWLRLADLQLHGDRFKFEDFFTVLDRDQVSELDVTSADAPALDVVAAARAATLPTSSFDADQLMDAFPAR